MNIGANSITHSFAIQRRVVGALVLREIITRYGRHNIGFLWLFIEPMMFTLGIASLWTFAKIPHYGMPIVAFAITGYSSLILWRNMPNRCSEAILPNLGLLYHRNVKIIDIYYSRIILESAGTTLSFIILGVIFTSTNLMSPPEDILKVTLGWLMLVWFGASLGIVVGCLSRMSEIVEKIWHPMTYLMFPISGAGFMVDWLPKSAQEIILYLPMVHGTEILREGYFGSTIQAHYDISYMATICLCLSLLGLMLTNNLEKTIIPE